MILKNKFTVNTTIQEICKYANKKYNEELWLSCDGDVSQYFKYLSLPQFK